jgi:uncharacterized membrane protein YfcA
MSVELIALSVITLVAATVNGALGYGFSSLTVPMALLFMSNRVLNPALVAIEVALNAYVLLVNRGSLPAVWRSMIPIVVGLMPGVIVGTTLVVSVDASWMKVWTFSLLIPLIFLQAIGYRRPVKAERSVGFLFGGGLGALYAVTTISGPPLALMLTNQGYAKRDFRAALGLVRLAESTLTAAAYATAGMFTITSAALSLYIVPSLALGVPLGAMLIRRVQADVFRRLCMSFDAWVVAFGLASVLRLLGALDTFAAACLFIAVAGFDACLLYRFFRRRTASLRAATTPWIAESPVHQLPQPAAE